MHNNLNPNREYYIDAKGQIRRGRKPQLLALYNQMVNYAMGYCYLKQCYLTPNNVSEKQCLVKGYKYYPCRHFTYLEGKECKYGIEHAKQKKWTGAILANCEEKEGVEMESNKTITEQAKKLMNAIYSDDEKQKEKIENTRDAFTDVTTFVLKNMKDSREKSLTLTKLEEACMWAIKGITREEE